jgi:hypothetical protein
MKDPRLNGVWWVALIGGYAFVISLDDKHGYMATCGRENEDEPPTEIKGGPWTSFDAAHGACRRAFRDLQRGRVKHV